MWVLRRALAVAAAGDLPLMWIRDSAVQISVLLPRIVKRPALRRVIEGALRAQAFYITQVGGWVGGVATAVAAGLATLAPLLPVSRAA